MLADVGRDYRRDEAVEPIQASSHRPAQCGRGRRDHHGGTHSWPAAPNPGTLDAGRTDGLAVAAACGLATLVSPFVPAIFPAKYSFDSTFIQLIALNVNLRRADQNYEAAAQFYRFLHLENLPKLTALLTMAVFCVSMALAVGRNRLHAASVPTLAAVYGSAVLAAVYISPYSKEAPVLLCVVMMLVISRSRTYAAIAMTMFMMLYAIEFRACTGRW